MDPDKLLEKLLWTARHYESTNPVDVATELSQGLLDLDAWLTTGGFLPQRWVGTDADEERSNGPRRAEVDPDARCGECDARIGRPHAAFCSQAEG